MADVERKCVKCAGDMEEGFILDLGQGAGLPADWVEGEPERSFWTGTKYTTKVRYRIRSYRCADCGFLESYAVGSDH